MRKITINSANAFHDNENFKSSNTEVVTDGHTTILSLFDHKIAFKDNSTNEIRITNCGYKTNTTKERLNGLTGVNINQKKGVWYLNGEEWDGKLITIKQNKINIK